MLKNRETPTSEGHSQSSKKPKSAEITPGPGFRVRKNISRPSKDLIAKFGDFDTADISDKLNRMYTMCAEIRSMTDVKRVVGPACTVKVFPGDNLMVHKALDIAQPGDVVVIDTTGSRNHAVLGDLITTKAKHRGIAGFVIDGLIRDVEDVGEVGLPVFARGVTAFGPLHRGPGEINYSVSCGGIVVEPGDIVAADSDGVVVVRKEFAETTIKMLQNHRESMSAYVADVRKGIFSNDWVDDQLVRDGCDFHDL